MEVIVKEKKYNYDSDYPDKWHFAHGDHFKIVRLDNGRDKATCFVKRFEVKTPASISGWGLMEQLKGKNIPKLARLYDIVNVEENRRGVYYVFSEYIEGETLYNLISKNAPVDLERLADSLFKSTATLQEKKYWFPDFTEKNIFFSKKGGFVLIDLDSTQPISVVPDKDIWGDKQYWALVFDFYTKFLRVQMVPSDIHGTTLTYLCIVFMILRIKIFQAINTREYGSLYDELTSFLYNCSPSFAQLFEKIFQDKELPPTPEDVDDIIRLVRENILPLTGDTINDIIEGKPVRYEPVINEFSISNYAGAGENDYFVVENGEKFTLHWEVENATNIELYRNGERFHSGTDEKSIDLEEEVRDKPERKIEYTLVALNDLLEKASASLAITVKHNREPEPVITQFILTDSFQSVGNDKYIVELGKAFTLEWEVENTSIIELYKNGTLYHTYKDEKSFQLKEEVSEDTEKELEYVLVASNTSLEKTAGYLFVTVVDNRPPEPVKPDIKRFLVTDYFKKNEKDSYTVVNGQSFSLGWEVENVSSIQLYKNGKHYRVLKGGKGNINIKKEGADPVGKRIEYQLKATNDDITVESNTVTVEFVDLVPAINNFRASATTVKSGKTFRLTWEVENITALQLLRNGRVYQASLDVTDRSIELREEKQDDNETEIIYTLLASNETQKVKSEPVIITVVEGKKWGLAHIVTLSAVALLIIAAVYYYSRSTPGAAAKISVNPFTQKVIAQDDTITITGDNLPENPGAIQVEFANVPGKIVQQSRNSIRVQVPLLTLDSGISISVYANGAFFNVAESLMYDKLSGISTAMLPLTLHEIWRSSPGNQYIYIDLLHKMLYYSSGDRNRYDTASTMNATYDSANGVFKVPITTGDGSKMLYIKNSTAQSFELCVGPNQPQAGCNNFIKMFLYYENSPSVIYLPASVNEAVSALDPSQSKRLLNSVNRQTNKNWSISLFHANPFIQPSSLNTVTGLLNERGIKFSVVPGNTDVQGKDPFERNYITVTPKKIDTTATAAASTTGTTTTGTTGTTGTTPGTTGSTSGAGPEIDIANGFDLGYLRFNARNEPDDVSKEILGVIATQLMEDNSSRITFYATWSNTEDQRAVSANISSLQNYLNRINIRLGSRQVDTRITSSTVARYNKTIRVVGFQFPKSFNLEKKLAEHRVEQQKLEQRNKKIKSIRENLDIAFRFKDGMAYCTISNDSPHEIEKVEVEVSYVPQFENDAVKKMLKFENVNARGGSTQEAPFLINSRQIEYNFRTVVPKESE